MSDFYFDVREHDGFGRIGRIKIDGKKLETPFFFPVVRPDRRIPEFLKNYPGVITNSYIFFRKFGMARNLREILGYNGLIMTDSGAYQLMVYGGVEVENAQIVSVQKAIGSDLGVILDIPPKNKENYQYVKKCVLETVKRAEEAKEFLENIPLVFPIHGSPYPDLLKLSAESAEESPYPMVGLGSIVPELIEYQYPEHVRALGTVRRITQKPLHMFGLGHPSFIPLAVYMGADTFDSASYVLFAEDYRIITPLGTRKIGEINRLPPWADITIEELKELPPEEQKNKIAEINFKAIVYETEVTKQAIEEGKLLDLVLGRAKIYPLVQEAVLEVLKNRWLRGYQSIVKRRAFNFTREKMFSEVVLRYVELLPKLIEFYRRELGHAYISSKKEPKKFKWIHGFGPVPYELSEVWPFFQHIVAEEAILEKMSRKRLEALMEEFEETQKEFERDIKFEIAVRAFYQLGKPISIDERVLPKFGPSGRLKEVLNQEGEKLLVFRAKDGLLIPQRAADKYLPELKWVETTPDVVGRDTVLARGIKKASKSIAPEDIVEIRVEGEKVGLGRARMNAKEMKWLNGVAVKVIYWL